MDYAHLSLEDPPRALAHGADLQTFRTRVRRAGSGAGTDPTFRLRLYESGTARTTLINQAVSGEGVLEATWDAATLEGRGGEVEVRLEADRGTGGSIVEIAALSWKAQLLAEETSPVFDDLTLSWTLYALVPKDVTLRWSTLSNFSPNFERVISVSQGERLLRVGTRTLSLPTATKDNAVSVGEGRGRNRLIN